MPACTLVSAAHTHVRTHTRLVICDWAEGLQHELRQEATCQLSAHLLVPGWTNTDIMVRTVEEKCKRDGTPFDLDKVLLSGHAARHSIPIFCLTYFLTCCAPYCRPYHSTDY